MTLEVIIRVNLDFARTVPREELLKQLSKGAALQLPKPASFVVAPMFFGNPLCLAPVRKVTRWVSSFGVSPRWGSLSMVADYGFPDRPALGRDDGHHLLLQVPRSCEFHVVVIAFDRVFAAADNVLQLEVWSMLIDAQITI